MAQEIYHRSEWGNPNEQWGNVYLNADLTNELYKRASEYENSWVTDQLLNGVGIKPSIIMTPTAYEDGKLNSVKPKGGENFFPYSEDFENSDWTKNSGTTITNNYAISPNGTQTASRYLGTGTSGLGDKFTLSAVGHTISFWVKSNNGSSQFCRLIGDSSQVSSDILVTTEWNRISYTFTASGLSNKTNGIFRDSSNNDIDILIWGAQLERGYLGVYNPTNGTAIKNADFDFTRGSSATRVNEQGLIQDVQILSGELVQNGNFEQIGSELVTNGTFDTDSDWTKGTGWSISGGQANRSGVSSNSFISQDFNIEQGKKYIVKYDRTYISGNGETNLYSYFDSNTTRTTKAIYNSTVQETVTVTDTFVAGHTGGLFLRVYGISNFTGSIDNISVKEVGQNWTLEGGWSVQNGLLVNDGTGVNLSATQSGFFTVGNKYRVSLDIKSITQGSLEIYLGFPQSDVKTINSIGSYTYDIIASGNTTFYIKPLNNFIGSIDNISVVEVTDDTDLPRINYTNFDYENGEVVPYSGEGSLLLEPQSTNLLTYSEDFSSWSISGSTIQTNNYGISPEGKRNSTRLQLSNNSIIYKALQTPFDGARSLYVKATSGSGTIQLLSHNTNTDNIFTIDENWQRVELSGAQFINQNFYLVDARGGSSTTIFDIEVWGAQYELLDYATSYIPTEGSTVTRLADVCNNSGSSDLINSTEGVLYAEISALADDGTYRNIALSDSSTSNRIVIVCTNISNQIRFYLQGNGGTITVNHTLTNITDFVKVAIKYKPQDFSFYVNGIEVDTSTLNINFSGLDDISFYNPFGGGTSHFYGNVKCVAVFKETDIDLEKLTQV